MCAHCHFRLAIYRDEQLVGWSNSFPDAVSAACASLWLRGRGQANAVHVNTRALTAWWDAHRGLVAVLDGQVMIRFIAVPVEAPPAPPPAAPRRSFWQRALAWLMGIRAE